MAIFNSFLYVYQRVLSFVGRSPRVHQGFPWLPRFVTVQTQPKAESAEEPKGQTV